MFASLACLSAPVQLEWTIAPAFPNVLPNAEFYGSVAHASKFSEGKEAIAMV